MVKIINEFRLNTNLINHLLNYSGAEIWRVTYNFKKTVKEF